VIDAGAWREALAALSRPTVTAVLTVQCDFAWLAPELLELRNEVDDAIAGLALSRPAVRVDRIILHSVPATGDASPGELATLNDAHADWVYRLSVVGDFMPAAARPRVHRVIAGRLPRSVRSVDGIEAQDSGRWEHPHAATVIASLLQAGATTPLTSYDIERDGPFGDADPSIYL
jgi:hypothetical protein